MYRRRELIPVVDIEWIRRHGPKAPELLLSFRDPAKEFNPACIEYQIHDTFKHVTLMSVDPSYVYPYTNNHVQ